MLSPEDASPRVPETAAGGETVTAAVSVARDRAGLSRNATARSENREFRILSNGRWYTYLVLG
jgi:hypothetical protein